MSGNDDLFFTGDFKPVLDIDQDLPNFAPDTGNSDYLLLKQLQEEEDQKLAAGLQKDTTRENPATIPKTILIIQHLHQSPVRQGLILELISLKN